MNYIIKNDKITVTISQKGGEILSIKGADQTEYLWQGDPTYWAGRAPHLFPFVGRLTNGMYRMDGVEHPLALHGFFRNKEMNFVHQMDTSLTLSMKDDEETHKEYDRTWEVQLTYKIEEATLFISFKVINLDSRTMYFGYGGHPGFNVPLSDQLQFEDYYLEFETLCHPVSIGMSPNRYLQGAHIPIDLIDDKYLPLCHELFDEDAIVLRNMAKTVSIRSKKDTHGVTIDYPDMPYLGLWHKPKSDAPYVCIEPWVSLPSRQDIVETCEEKQVLVVLAAGKTYCYTWSINVF